MTISEMREKRNKLVGMMDTFLDTHSTDKGTLSPEDDKTYKDMETEVAQLTDSIHRMERREEIEAELSKPTSKPLTGKPMQTDGDKPTKTGRASDEYKKAMLTALKSNFRQISNVLQEGIDPQGGYLVPDEYDSRLIDILTEENVMRTLGTRITTSGEHKINIAATKPAAAWIEEGGALTFGDATLTRSFWMLTSSMWRSRSLKSSCTTTPSTLRTTSSRSSARLCPTQRKTHSSMVPASASRSVFWLPPAVQKSV